MEIYSTGGARVRGLVDELLGVGRHVVTWDGRDAAGRPVPAGVYFVRLDAGSHRQNAKLVRTQ